LESGHRTRAGDCDWSVAAPLAVTCTGNAVGFSCPDSNGRSCPGLRFELNKYRKKSKKESGATKRNDPDWFRNGFVDVDLHIDIDGSFFDMLKEKLFSVHFASIPFPCRCHLISSRFQRLLAGGERVPPEEPFLLISLATDMVVSSSKKKTKFVLLSRVVYWVSS